MTIFIGNLSWDTEIEHLKELFNTYDAVQKCYMPLERDTGATFNCLTIRLYNTF